MKQILLICALVGCGESKEEQATKATAEARAVAEAKAAETAKTPQQPETTSEKLITDPIVEKAIRKELEKPTGELTKADLEKVTGLHLAFSKLTEVPKDVEKLTQLRWLDLWDNPDLTKAQINELQKALPNCEIYSNGTK